MPELSGSDAAGTTPNPAASGKWGERLGHVDRLVSRRSQSQRVRTALLVVSLVAFVALAGYAWAALPTDVVVVWPLMLLLVASMPLTAVGNAAEYHVMARIVGTAPSFGDSLRLTLIATAANLLPVPGAIMIRAQALRADGVAYKRAFAANAVAGGAWVGVSVVGVGVLALAADNVWWGACLLLGGVGSLGVSIGLVQRMAPEHLPLLIGQLVAVEVYTMGVSALRVFLAFGALSISISSLQAVALTFPTILAAIIGIFPAGLGLREALAGVIGVVVDLPVAESIAATAADRVCAQISLAALTTLMLLIGGRAGLASVARTDADPPA